MRRLLPTAVFLALMVAGCGSGVSELPAAPMGADVDRNHEKIFLDPAEPGPGMEIVATFSQTNSRGGYFHLFHWDGSDWGTPVYQLESDANGAQPSAVRVADGVGMDDYGVEGPGPERLVLPDLEAGHWRLCTANARDRACAPLIAVGVDGS
ncbi:MAG: hypothetical protein GY926_14840 [bacterium]|nr:hypothetical protein [bacterium]